jgi:threonine dehydratase
VAIKSLDPEIQVIGVQAEAVAPYPGSLAAGHPVSVQASPTMADGIAVSRPGDIPFGILSGHAGRVVTVSEENLSRGLVLCLERAKQVVEPAGAAGVAAVLEHARDFVPPVVVVLSGGNIDPLLLSKLLRHGLTAAGRYLAFRCRLPDRPGSLAKLLGDLADLGANVLEVAHERLAPRLHVDEAEVILQVETRGPEHCADVISALRATGYTLAFGLASSVAAPALLLAGIAPYAYFSDGYWLTLRLPCMQGGLDEYVEAGRAGMLMGAAATSWWLPGRSLWNPEPGSG